MSTAPSFCFALAAFLWLPDSCAQDPTIPRILSRDGDVRIAGLFPLFELSNFTDECEIFRPFRALNLVEPFLFVLRRRSYSLTAEVNVSSAWLDKNETPLFNSSVEKYSKRGPFATKRLIRRSLRLGYFVGDMCKLVSSAVRFSVLATLRSPGVQDCSKSAENDPDSSFLGQSKNVVAMIGPTTSMQTAAVAPLLASSDILQISPAATSDYFACHLKTGGRCESEYEYLFRTVPSDQAQVDCIVDMLTRFGWSHIAVLSSHDLIHLGLRAVFTRNVEQKKFCVSFSDSFRPRDKSGGGDHDRDVRRIVEKLNKSENQRLRVMVLFALDEQAEAFFEALEKFCKSGYSNSSACLPRVWIGNDGWSHYAKRFFGRESHRSAGVSTIITAEPELPSHLRPVAADIHQDFSDFLRHMTVEKLKKAPPDPWLCPILEELRVCEGACSSEAGNRTFSNCSEKASFPEKSAQHEWFALKNAGHAPVFIATEVVLTALSNLFQEFTARNPLLSGPELPKTFLKFAHGRRLLEATKKVRLGGERLTDKSTQCQVFPQGMQEVQAAYKIQANMADGSFATIGSWGLACAETSNTTKFRPISDRIRAVKWPRTDAVVFGNTVVPKFTCNRPCKPGQERVILGACCHECVSCIDRFSSNGTGPCEKCPIGYTSESGVRCIPLPLRELPSSVRIPLTVAFILVACSVASTALLYSYKRRSPVVRADFTLSFALLTSLLVLLLAGGVSLLQPSLAVCLTTRVLSAPAILFSVSILFVKTWRLARLGCRAGRLRRLSEHWSLKTSAQVSYMFVLTAVGTTVEYCNLLVNLPHPTLYHATEDSLRLCLVKSANALSLAYDIYVVLLITLIVIPAFYTRKMPLNFNEARLLFLCTFSLLTSGFLLRLVLYMSSEERRAIVECVQAIAHALVIWLWLFVPRLYIILIRPERNTASIPSSMRFASPSIYSTHSASGGIRRSSLTPSDFFSVHTSMQLSPYLADLTSDANILHGSPHPSPGVADRTLLEPLEEVS